MRCQRPFGTRYGEARCGRCLPCRITKRSEWTTRLMLEAQSHEASCFVTLTYAPEHLPGVDRYPRTGNLDPKELTLFLKRFRRLWEYRGGEPFRYFACGEYGETGGRAHFHVLLFGVPYETFVLELLQQAWGKGHVHLGEVNEATCAYTCGYLEKKLTKFQPEDGRHPEFSRMSRNGVGGIGAKFMERIAQCAQDAGGLDTVTDVPGLVRIGGRTRPVGRYLKTKLREAAGWDKETPPERLRELAWQWASNTAEDIAAREAKRRYDAARALTRSSISRSKRTL